MQCSKPRRYSTTSSGAREQCRWNFEASAIAVVRLNMSSSLVGYSTGI
jgi:hypothetical protein